MAIKHAKTSTIPDGIDANVIRPSDWNADHTGTNDHDHSSSTSGSAILAFTRTAHYTGFPNRTDTTLSWNDGSYTLTLGGTNFKIWLGGIEYTVSSSMTKQITDATGVNWFWIELSGGVPTLMVQASPPGFDKCLVATVYWNTTTNKGILSDERHWMGRDKWMHEYLHQTVGARWYTGGTITYPTDSTFQLTECEMYDEDIQHILPLATTCKIFYKNGSADWVWDTGQTYLAKINGSTIRYNNGNALADVDNSKYAAMWVYATNQVSEPFISIIGQRQDATIQLARTNNTPDSISYGVLPSAEIKLLYRVIFRQGTTAPIETADYRAVSNLPVSNYTATDHSTLSNLSYATSGHTGFQESLTGLSPITVSGSSISISAATSGSAGSMSATDKAKLDYLTLASATSITGGGTIALAGYTLTIPASGSPALLGTANTFTASNNNFQGTTANDLPTYSDEFLDSANWTLGSGWSGNFASGFTHASGSGTATLTHDHAAVATTKYQFAYTVTGMTTGTFDITFGGESKTGISGTGTWGPTATTTGSLVITPTDTFNGTIVISIKSLTAASTALVNLKNSAGTVVCEIRSGNVNSNVFMGTSSGKYCTTGYQISAIGVSSVGNNTNGYQNTAIGNASLYENTTGFRNIAIGTYAGRTIITGNSNTFVGYAVGYNASQKVDAVNSTAIGANTYTTANNQVVIGDTNVTSTIIRGAISILANNIVTDTTTGMKIGTATDQKIGFFNVTPVVQPSAYTQTYSTASKTVSAPTAGTLTDGSGGTANTTLESVGTTYSQSVIRNNFADLAAMANKNTADSLVLFKVVTALIDDLQALGLVS